MDPSSLHGLELDTEQEEGMIPLTHFPLPVEYARAEQDAREANAGPHPYGTTEAYFARLYGTHMLAWRGVVGNAIYYSALARTALVLDNDIGLMMARDMTTERVMVPLMTHFIGDLFYYVVNFDQDQENILRCCGAFQTYIKNVDNDFELSYLVEPLIPPIAELDACKGKLNPAERQQWLQRWHVATHFHHLPIPALILQLEEAGDEEEVIIEGFTDEEMDLSTLNLDGVRTEPLPEPTLPAMVKQLDGSMALSAYQELCDIFIGRPRRAILDDIEAQAADSIEQHKSPYKDALALWWKLDHNRREPEIAHLEARALDVVGMLLLKLIPLDKFAILARCLPVDEIVANAVSFAAGDFDRQVPNLSWQQLRVSLFTMPIGRIAAISKKDAIDVGVEIYEKLGWHDDIPLLRVTIDTHAEAMEASVRRTLATTNFESKQ